MRLSGFASGMDINQIVSDLMRAQRMPLNKLTQQKQILEWKRDDYREINQMLTDFSNLSFEMTLQRTFTTKQVTSSNSQAVTATASAQAPNSSFTISNVVPATGSYAYSKGISGTGEKVSTNSGLLNQASNFANSKMSLEDENSIWTGRRTHEVAEVTNEVSVPAGMTLLTSENAEGQLEPKPLTILTDEGPITFNFTTNRDEIQDDQVYYDRAAGKLIFGKDIDAGSTINSFAYEDITTSFSITTYSANNEPVTHEFTIKSNESLNDVISKINSSGLGLSAFYDEGNDGLMLSRTETGKFNNDGSEISVSGSFINDVLNFGNTNARFVDGQKATFELNGMPTTRDSNTFSVNGVTFTLNGPLQGSATINVANDNDKTFNAIKNYVDKYNELIEKINGKLTEEVHRSYKPLSDEERESLTEKQIEQWEEKARSGLLRNDNILSSSLNRMRTAFYSPVSTSGPFNQLAQIGIATGANYMDRGKIILDEDKLRAAIAQDPTSVMELFNKAKDSETGQQGLARQLRENVQGAIRQIEQRAGNASRTNHQFTIGRELNSLDQRMTQFEARMKQVEDRYWRQFTAMEKAMDTANSQAMQLMSMFYPQQ